MLLNEFLKEHRKVENLEATVAKQKEDLIAMSARQEAQIKAITSGLEKVSDELAKAKGAPRVVTTSKGLARCLCPD